MAFVLILLALGNESSSSDILHRPQVIGQFESLQECKDAAATAQFVKVGKFNARPYAGAQLMCVRSK
jgi:hypothetical protein